MIEIILAAVKTEQGLGIGLKNSLPWGHIETELAIFKVKTADCVLIAGSVTYELIKHLQGTFNRVIKVVNQHNSFESVLTSVQSEYPSKKIFVVGGGKLYNHVFKFYSHIIDYIHISFINKKCDCDTFVTLDEGTFEIISTQNFCAFEHVVMKPRYKGEVQYLNLLKRVANSGQLTYGRNGVVKSLFSSHLSFNLQNGFPLLTTKKMFFRGIVEELIFFLKGETDSKLLEAKKINIWKGNTNREFLDAHGKTTYEEGDMGPMYGYQWRNFGKEYKNLDSKGVDQLLNVINTIKTDPKSRRILMTDYNPAQADEGVLYPCHSIIIQFYVDDQGKFLDMYCFNRSSDLFLGLPFNIASSALLLTIISHLTNLSPRMLYLSLGNCHIYEEHFKQVEEQLTRIPFQFPLIQVVKPFEKVEELTFEHFEVIAYKSHESIKAVMVS